jgi:ferredoxin hydrogenase large subunit
MQYFQVNDRCNGCMACVENCPATALRATDRDGVRTLAHNMTRCARCGNCKRVCPNDAVEFQHLIENDHWDDFRSLELVCCRVCGEPLYTVQFQQGLRESLSRDAEPYCPRHREEIAAVGGAHFRSSRQPADKGASQ